MTTVFKREKKKENVNEETKIRVMNPKQSNVRNHWKLEKIRKDSSLEPSEEVCPCFPLISDFYNRERTSPAGQNFSSR